MYYWIIYDISKNRTRQRIAVACKRAGLQRVQKSVFLGKVKKKTLNHLRTQFNRLVNWRTDKVFFVPMNDREFRNITRTGAKRQTPLVPQTVPPAFY